MKKISVLFLAAVFLLLPLIYSVPVKATEAPNPQALWPAGPTELYSDSATLIDFDSGTVLFNKAETEKRYPASITKIMTALLALENCSLDEVVTFSHYAVFSIEAGSSSIYRDENEQMTMEECLYALLLASANEVANAIAEHVAGSIDAFADMMNAKAAELGCVNTHFANPHGLHDENHYTCSHDMALIAREAYKNPTFALIVSTKTYIIPPTNKHEEPTPLSNTHGMLNYYRTNQFLYEYCLGGKTGYTDQAGLTLVTIARKNGITLLSVVMHSNNSGHYLDTTALFNYYFDRLQTLHVSDITSSIISGDNISEIASLDERPYAVDKDAKIVIPVNADLTYLNMSFNAIPEDSGNVLGSIGFEYGGRNVGSANLKGITTKPNYYGGYFSEAEEKEEPIVINVSLIIVIVIAVAAALIIIRFAIIRVSGAVTVMRRRRFENRDPHKNMRMIKRRKRKRKKRRD